MPKSVKGVMHEWKTGQLHSGSSTGPVVTNQKQAVAVALSEQRAQQGQPSARPARPLHPALAAHAQRIKAAHAHLSATVPGFRRQPPAAQFQATQAHVRKMRGR